MHFKSGSLKNAIASLMYFVSVSSTPSSRFENGVVTVYTGSIVRGFPPIQAVTGISGCCDSVKSDRSLQLVLTAQISINNCLILYRLALFLKRHIY